jgi:hypothetical protein
VKQASAAAALILWMSAATAADYSPDDLCRAIGETPVVALQPRDRLYLEKNCECVASLGCAARGGARATKLRKIADETRAAERAAERNVAAKEAEQRRAAQEKERRRRAKANAATADLRKTFVACQADVSRLECRNELVALQDACDTAGAYADLQQCIEGL